MNKLALLVGTPQFTHAKRQSLVREKIIVCPLPLNSFSSVYSGFACFRYLFKKTKISRYARS